MAGSLAANITRATYSGSGYFCRITLGQSSESSSRAPQCSPIITWTTVDRTARERQSRLGPQTLDTRDHNEPLANLVYTFDYGAEDTLCVSSFRTREDTQLRKAETPDIDSTHFPATYRTGAATWRYL